MAETYDQSIGEALAVFRRSLLLSLRVAFPARVVAYNATDPPTADIVPTQRLVVNVGGVLTETEPPKIFQCPVKDWRGGGFFASGPLAAGDEGIALVCDRELDGWLESGATAAPHHTRAHSMTDSVFLPGVSSQARRVAARSATDFVCGREDGSAVARMTPAGDVTISAPSVSLDAATVNVGHGASAAAVLGEAFMAWFDAHTHPVLSLGAPTSPPTVLTSASPVPLLSESVQVAP